MGEFTALHWIILFGIGGLVYYFFSSNSRAINSAELDEARIREISNKFDGIEPAELKKMTVAEIAVSTGSTERGIIARLIRRQLQSKDFDGTMSAEERARRREVEKNIGALSPQIICPHCQVKGQVYKKLGVDRRENTTDTTNLTAAILSGTKTTVRKVTQLHCVNCDTTWDI